MRSYRWFSLVFLFLSFTLRAQFLVVGQDPFSLKWRQINTAHFQVLYEEGFEEEAQRMANTLDAVYEPTSAGLNNRPKKISVILHNQTVEHNGFVTWAPKRSEFYVTPPQDQGMVDWLDLLCVHELRHVVQIDKFDQGFTHVLSLILGEQAIGGMLGLTTPRWWLEGDATLTETLLSNGGRGRLPSFTSQTRAMAMTSGLYSYDKQMFGSYKDFVPNRYHFGYWYNTYAMREYGDSVWINTMETVTRRPIYPWRLSSALKKETGVNAKGMYYEMKQDLESKWNNQETENLTAFKPMLMEEAGLFTHYKLPTLGDSGVIYAIKEGIADPLSIVEIKNGKETLVHRPGLMNTTSLSYANGLMCWAHFIPDERWELQSYSDIAVYDVAEGRRFFLTKEGRFFAPQLNQDGSKIVAVEINKKNECRLVELDLESGEALRMTPWESGVTYKTPTWLLKDDVAFVKFQTSFGNSLVRLNLDSKSQEVLLEGGYVSMKNPSGNLKEVYFDASFSGKDELYRWTASGVQKVTESSFGAVDPVVFNDRLTYCGYTPQGFKLVESSTMTAVLNTDIASIEDKSLQYYQPLVDGDVKNVFQNVGDKKFESKKYRKGTHLFNIHSWQPVAADEVDLVPKVGFLLRSQNKLSSSVLQVGYSQQNMGSLRKWDMGWSLMPFYVKLDISASQERTLGAQLVSEGNSYLVDFQRQAGKLRAYVPFNLTRGNSFTFLTPSVSISSDLLMFEGDSIRGDYGLQVPVDYNIQFARFTRRSKRDLFPKWGQVARVSWAHTPFGGDITGQRFSASLLQYFPGLAKHHGLRVKASMQTTAGSGRRFSSYGEFPRGYAFRFPDEVYFASVDYRFPLLYPDLALSFLTYIQRVQVTLFSDFGRSIEESVNEDLHSTGVEFVGDVNVLRYDAELDLGARLSYRHTDSQIVAEFLWAINF